MFKKIILAAFSIIAVSATSIAHAQEKFCGQLTVPNSNEQLAGYLVTDDGEKFKVYHSFYNVAAVDNKLAEINESNSKEASVCVGTIDDVKLNIIFASSIKNR